MDDDSGPPPVNETRKLVFQTLMTLVPFVGLGAGALIAYHFAYRTTLDDWDRVLATWMTGFGGVGLAVGLAGLVFWILYKIDPRHAVSALRSIFFDPV